MSSKKRRKSREWMQHTTAKLRSAEHNADRARRDLIALTTHVPEQSEQVYREAGKIDTISFIDKFPSPRESGEHLRFVMPEVNRGGPYPSFGYRTEVMFRAAYHVLKVETGYGDAILKWVSWEPTQTPEGVTQTRNISNVRRQLAQAIVEVRHAAYYYAGLDETVKTLDGVYSQLAGRG